MTLEMKVKLLWESHRVVWRQDSDCTKKPSTFIVMVCEQITSRG